MTRSLLEEAADRAGWATYLFVVGGGVPFWAALFLPAPAEPEEAVEAPIVVPTATPPPIFDPPYIGVRSLELIPAGEFASPAGDAGFVAA